MDNPLYNLQNKKTLAALLFYDEAGYMLQDIPFINNYNVFILENKLSNGEKKQRIVETPQGMLKTIHNRIFKFLNRLDLPDYLISKKNSSYINNHLVHKQNSHILTMDISKFYPMCSFAKVNWFFLNSMKMSEDTSYIISKILTINYDEMKIKEDVQTYFDSLKKNENIVFPREHIPTGSSVSNILSFLSYKDMFDKIYTLSLFRNIKMTVYVDDLTFSSDRKIPSEFIHDVKRIIKDYGHILNRKKSKLLGPNHNKNITGVIITKNKETKIPNKLHHKYKKAKNAYIGDPIIINKQKYDGIKEAMKQIIKVSKENE